MTTRLEENNTELMKKLPLSEKGIWEKIDLLTVGLLERAAPMQPDRPPGPQPGRLIGLEGAFKELGEHLTAVDFPSGRPDHGHK